MTRKTNSSEATNLAMERDIASGKVLVDGVRIKMLTPEEARARFGESETDLVITTVPTFKRKTGPNAR